MKIQACKIFRQEKIYHRLDPRLYSDRRNFGGHAFASEYWIIGQLVSSPQMPPSLESR